MKTKEKITLRVNGKQHQIDADPATPLLYVLRNKLELNGPKFGCGLEQCGACMVLIDGRAQTSCLTPVAEVMNKEITTLEGLIDQDGTLHPMQRAIIEEQAAQCGYCVNGMIISAVAMLNENSSPDRKTINENMNPVLCRCGTYSRFLKAIRTASGKINE